MSNAKSDSATSLAAGAPPRAPLAGVVVLGALVVGFVGWTGVRIRAATQAQADVSLKRTVAAQKAIQEAAAPERVHVVRGESQPILRRKPDAEAA